MAIYELEERVFFDGAIAADTVESVEASETDNISNEEAADNAEAHASNEQTTENLGYGCENEADLQAGSDSDSLEEIFDSLGNDECLSDDITSTKNLLLVSSAVDNSDVIIESVNDNTIVIAYDREASLEEVLAQIDETLGETIVKSIGIVSHSSGVNCFNLTDSEIVSSDSVGVDIEQNEFWNVLRNYLGDNGRIDIFACDVAQGEIGMELIDSLESLTSINFAASDDATGNESYGGNWTLESDSIDLMDVYFSDNSEIENYDSLLDLPGAHSATVDGEVFLGGNYLEIGISSSGSYGTIGSAPDSFYGTSGSSSIGLSTDADGFGIGEDLRIDYFLPGSPAEGWSLGYISDGDEISGYNATLYGGINITVTDLQDTSSGDILSATYTGILGELQADVEISFGVNDNYFVTTVTLTNIGDITIENVRYMRSFDPDNTVYYDGSYTTINTIEQTFEAGDGAAAVSATSLSGDAYETVSGSQATIMYYSTDESAVVSTDVFFEKDPFSDSVVENAQEKGFSITDDTGITICCDVGSLASGESKTISFYTSLSNASVGETIAELSDEAVTPDEAATPEYIGGEVTGVTPDLPLNPDQPSVDNGMMINDSTQVQTITSWHNSVDNGSQNDIDSSEGFEHNEVESVGLGMHSMLSFNLSVEGVSNGEYSVGTGSSSSFMMDGEYGLDSVGISGMIDGEYGAGSGIDQFEQALVGNDELGAVDLTFNFDSSGDAVNFEGMAVLAQKHPTFKTELDLLLEKI